MAFSQQPVTTTSSFNFGSPGFSFGLSAPVTTSSQIRPSTAAGFFGVGTSSTGVVQQQPPATKGGLFSLGTGQQQPSATGFTLGAPSFGTGQQQPAATSAPLTFGSPGFPVIAPVTTSSQIRPSSTAGFFGVGTTSTSTVQQQPPATTGGLFTLGVPSLGSGQQQPAATGFNLGASFLGTGQQQISTTSAPMAFGSPGFPVSAPATTGALSRPAATTGFLIAGTPATSTVQLQPPATTGGLFSLGAPSLGTWQQQTTTTGFTSGAPSLGTMQQQTTTTGFALGASSLGTGQQQPSATGGFTMGAPSLGTGQQQPAATSAPLTFGSPGFPVIASVTTSSQIRPSTTAGIFGVGTTSTSTVQQQPPAPAGGLFTSLGGVPSLSTGQQQPAATGVTLGAPSLGTGQQQISATGGFTLGAPFLGTGQQQTSATSAPMAFGSAGFPVSATTGALTRPATTTGFLVVGTPSTSTVQLQPPATTGGLFTLGVPSLGSGQQQPAATSAPLVAPTPTSIALQPPITSVAAAAAVTVDAPKPITYKQLEDLINKWTTDLEEQERLFLTQATQINAWDRMLMENSDKILKLSDDVDQLEVEQRRADYELDFVAQQQTELNQIVEQLEKTLVTDSDAIGAYGQHSDVRRKEMVQLQGSIDCQLKQVGRDMAQLIERINTASDANSESEPLKQIAAILSKQMDSLQWLDEQIVTIERRSQQVQNDVQKQRKDAQEKLHNLRPGQL